ncbi:hypothetical protein Agub_g13720, partial [Astrephomene gubernaculifera]
MRLASLFGPSLQQRRPPICPAAQALAPIPHQPAHRAKQGWFKGTHGQTLHLFTTSTVTCGPICAIPKGDAEISPTNHVTSEPRTSNTAPSLLTPSTTTTNSPPLPTPAQIPLLNPVVFLTEVASGKLLDNASKGVPKVPWGPMQLVQVMGWTTALALVAATAAPHIPRDLAAVLMSDDVRTTAVRHLGLELLCCCASVAVLGLGLRGSQPRSAGMFRFDLPPAVAVTVVALAAVAYPLADPLLYDMWSAVEQALPLQSLLSPHQLLSDPGSTLASQLRDCQAAGEGVGLVLHGAASCLAGPLWEEVFWRGFFLASMTRVLPLPACVALSSTAFAALHPGPGNWLPIAVLSGCCDVLYLRCGSLAAPLLLHAGWNAY